MPTPPPGRKPRPSASSFNEKFARRFLRKSGGGGGGQDTANVRTRGGDGGKEGLGLGRGSGHRKATDGGKSPRDKSPTSRESHCRSHITSVAVSHMYQVSNGSGEQEGYIHQRGGDSGREEEEMETGVLEGW